MKTKPFDLQAAINGAKLVTRDGREAKFIAYVPEAKFIAYVPEADKLEADKLEADKPERFIALIGGLVIAFYEDGVRHKGSVVSATDLFLVVQTRSINGYEYPEPETVEPEKGTRYWCPSHLADEDVYASAWYGTLFDMLRLRRGLVHLTREAAKAHARAIILAGGGEV